MLLVAYSSTQYKSRFFVCVSVSVCVPPFENRKANSNMDDSLEIIDCTLCADRELSFASQSSVQCLSTPTRARCPQLTSPYCYSCGHCRMENNLSAWETITK